MREVSIAIASLAVILPVLAGLFGIWSLFRPPVRDRTDRIGGIGCSATVAVATSAVIGFFGHQLGAGMIVGYTKSLLDDLLLFAPIGGLFGLAALGGYAFFARRIDGATAFAGVIIGPLVLIIVPLGIASTVGRAAGY